MKFDVFPASCMQDEPCNVIAKNLLSYQNVTITCHLEDHLAHKFFSYAHFIASKDGVVDVSAAISVGGSYFGCIQMGLISTLRPEPDEYTYLRFFKLNPQKPDKIQFRIYEGHCTPETLFSPDTHPLNCISHYRHYVGPGVEMVEVSEGRLRGTMFLPKSSDPQPGIIDMYGTGGRLLEHRAALLASRGFVSMALAYFDFERPHADLDISYFREAVYFLLKHPKVSKPYVGVVGISKGAEMALSMAAYIPEIKVAVCINGPTANTLTNLRVDEETILPPLASDMSRINVMNQEYCVNREMLEDPRLNPQSVTPFVKSNAHFLYIVGEDDQALSADRMAKFLIDSLKSAGKDNYTIYNVNTLFNLTTWL